ncbi:dUTP diphosphatase [Mesomycoplasma lagogenitalium]|uniref:dUTP diphosphatase n=1 Tax=Mesomycoplasma lagogenitalium TaxID=171286 RepID=A0ABY8LT43_9BACT|nr:dUTP diphosphatase [Mesomycoplasma lagogenitalium]WGI36411.1 dUTP diphosphatase [Mesomycoplasma lagogenitalium]
MNLKKIFDCQKEIDLKFGTLRSEANNGEDNLANKITLAIIVEIAEFANEIQTFKYWKLNKNINKEKIMEEWADIIHFLSSCANKLELESEINPFVASDNVNFQFKHAFKAAVEFQENFNKENLRKLYSLILGFLNILNVKEQELIDAYFKKVEINLKRIENKY